MTDKTTTKGLGWPVLGFALSLSLMYFVLLPPVQAQTAAGTPAAEEDGEAPAIEEVARTALMRTAARIATEVPENAPGAVDLSLIGVEGVPPQLTEGIIVKAWTRYVAVEGRLIGQVVAAGLEKGGRVEALEPAQFAAQFDLDQPRLEPEDEVVIEGDRAALMAALERLNEAPDEEPQTVVVEAESDDPVRGDSGGRGSAPRNDEAAGYQSPARLDIDEPVEGVRVTAEGCPVRIDLAQAQAIQQSRTETLEDGVVVGESACSDSAERYPLQRSYSVCTDEVDLGVRTATARYILFYTDSGGKRADVTDCAPDPDRAFPIVEDASSCGVFLDYDQLQAVPQSALVYLDESNREVQVRGCGASEAAPAVPMTLETNLCTLRHDYAGGLSHQQGAYVYTLGGVKYQAGGCVDTGTSYRHETVTRDSLGALVCERAVDFGGGRVTLQNRKRIVADGAPQYVSECAPVSGGAVALVSTTEGCDDPAEWTHDLSAAQSYAEERFYYLENANREYVTECRRSETVYRHQQTTTGWRNHDGARYAFALTTVWIEPPSGRYEVATGIVLPGAQQMPYQLIGTVDRPNGQVSYEGCEAIEASDRVERWERPDTTIYEKRIGEGAPVDPVYSCTVAEESRVVYSHSSVSLSGAALRGRYCKTASCSDRVSSPRGWPARPSDLAAYRSCSVVRVPCAGCRASITVTHYEQRQVRTVTTFRDGTQSVSAWANSGVAVRTGGFGCASVPPPPREGEGGGRD